MVGFITAPMLIYRPSLIIVYLIVRQIRRELDRVESDGDKETDARYQLATSTRSRNWM